jgi:hypothetical protein
VAKRDREAVARKDVDLTEGGRAKRLVVVDGAQDDEVVALVALELRALVFVPSILDREVVQREAFCDFANLLRGRIVDAKPDEASAAGCAPCRVGDRHWPGMLPRAVLVVSAVDDHGSVAPVTGLRFGVLRSCLKARSHG